MSVSAYPSYTSLFYYRLFRQGINQYREISIYKVHDRKQKQGRNNTYNLLVLSNVTSTLIVAVAQTSLDMLARGVLLFRLCEISVLFPALLRLRIIKTRLVIESSDLLLPKKTEIEPHVLSMFSSHLFLESFKMSMRHIIHPSLKTDRQIYGFLFTFVEVSEGPAIFL